MATESEFWKVTIERYELHDKLEAILTDSSSCWPNITRLKAEESKNGCSTVLLGNEIHLEIKRAVSDSENFMSQVFRLHAKENEHSYRCFVKVFSEDQNIRELTKNQNFFTREISMYADVFPHMRNLLEHANLKPSDYLLVPELYHANNEIGTTATPDKTILVLEDLNSSGYGMIDKSHGCDLAHAKVVLHALACYHALSIIVLRSTRGQRDYYKYLENFVKQQPTGMLEAAVAFQKPRVTVCRDAMSTVGYRALAEELEKLSDNLPNLVRRETEQQAGILSCLLHGDCWTNNILFQYDQSRKPTRVALVDWQVAAVGHPGKDIAYFFMTSTPRSLWRNSWTELLHYYFQTLNDLLGKLGLDLGTLGYSVTNFLDEFAVRVPKALPLTIMVLTLIHHDEPASTVNKEEESYDHFTKDKKTNEANFREITPQPRMSLNALTLPQLLSDHALCDRYADLLLELHGRGWL